MVNYKYKGVDCPDGYHPFRRRGMKHKICRKNPGGGKVTKKEMIARLKAIAEKKGTKMRGLHKLKVSELRGHLQQLS